MRYAAAAGASRRHAIGRFCVAIPFRRGGRIPRAARPTLPPLRRAKRSLMNNVLFVRPSIITGAVPGSRRHPFTRQPPHLHRLLRA
ncbi:unnamed protein product, partial [Iphiclides podalirius]